MATVKDLKDPEAALDFALELSNVMLGNDELVCGPREEYDGDLERLASVINVLMKYTCVRYATLWKVKERAGHLSVVARPWQEPDADLPFVVPIEGSIFGRAIEECRRRREADPVSGGNMSYPSVYYDDVDALEADGVYLTEERKRHLHGMRLVIIPFGSICQPNLRDTAVPNFLFSLAIENRDEQGDQTWIPKQALKAVTAKLLSGICAIIDRRMKRITDAMTAIRLANANAGSDLAIRRALKAVLPRYIHCQGLLRIYQTPEGGYHVAMNHWPDNERAEREAIPQAVIDRLGVMAIDLFEVKDAAENVHPARSDTEILDQADLDDLNDLLGDHPWGEFRSVLIGRIHNRIAPQTPRGFVALVNRSNDLSDHVCSGPVGGDYFDWEDEIYLNHICSVLDLIAELFTAEESRLRRANILAHEIHAPNGFIYATAERILEALRDERDMPSAMMRREVEELMTTVRLQSTLVDSMMMGMQTGSAPPSSRYVPSRVDLDEIGTEVKRLVLPLCRRFRVESRNIKMHGLPTLRIDRRAATQMILNLTNNAVKYAFASKPDDFALTISAEDVSVEELRTTNAPKEFVQRMENLKTMRGILLSFQDEGIGVTAGFEERIFAAGARESTSPKIASRTGAGLGLSVVRTIARDHFGEIWLENRVRPTLFHIFFPEMIRTGSYRTLQEWQTGTDAHGK